NGPGAPRDRRRGRRSPRAPRLADRGLLPAGGAPAPRRGLGGGALLHRRRRRSPRDADPRLQRLRAPRRGGDRVRDPRERALPRARDLRHGADRVPPALTIAARLVAVEARAPPPRAPP